MKKNSTIKRIMSLLLVAIVMVSALCMTAFAGSSSASRNGVVLVATSTGYGSGFAIGKVGKPVQYIVTNAHVVGDNNQVTVVFDGASNEMVSALVYEVDVNRDIAVLKLPQPTDKREALVLCPIKDVNVDDDFVALGYPEGQAEDVKKFNMDDVTVTRGGIKKQTRFGGQDVYILDIAITHGNSGGPLVNSNGEVVGINAFGVAEEKYAIAIDELLAFIDTDKIPVTLHGAINWPLILIIAAAVIAAAIIVLVIILIARKNKGDNASAYVAADEMAQVAPIPQGMQGAVAPQGGASARISAIGGTLNGRKYTLNGSIMIGRDSSRCGIAFPVNTQGVSGVHCEVSFNGSVAYIKDLSSSYGTFTIDGQRLAPNAPKVLKSGEKFYLASPENTFEVTF